MPTREPVVKDRAIGVAFVNVYELNRVYGGPEEGGWWFTTGEIVRSLAVPTAEANDYAATLEVAYPRGTGLENCGSVRYAGGDFDVAIEDNPGANWPSEYPHYE
jgi:hypothetical protein